MSAVDLLRAKLSASSAVDHLTVRLTPESAATQKRNDGGQFAPDPNAKSKKPAKGTAVKPKYYKVAAPKGGKKKKGGKGKTDPEAPTKVKSPDGTEATVKAKYAKQLEGMTTPMQNAVVANMAKGMTWPDAVADAKKKAKGESATKKADAEATADFMAKLHVSTSSRPTPPPP
jgi:hypothetical protein